MNKNIRLSFVVVFAVAFFSVSGVFAAADVPVASTDEFASAKLLISQGAPCGQLSQDQLEQMGDYYMEQMMPGQAHKNMEQVLGGEGSENLKQMHILMARRWYCGDAVGMGMMGMMSGFYNQ